MYFFFVILITGVVTTFTDLRTKKIYNYHLLVSAILGLIGMAYTIFNNGDILFQVTNGIFAFIVGYILHHFELWRGGDAKLFTLYAFLMPSQTIIQPIFGNTISLFVCSFIAGMTILMPVFVRDIIRHRKAFAEELASPSKRQAVFNGIERTITFFWVFSPLLQYFNFSNPIINLTMMFLVFTAKFKLKNARQDFLVYFIKRNSLRILVLLTLGILLRLWLTPNSLNPNELLNYLFWTVISTPIYFGIYSALSFFKNYQDRVPFSPLLFVGCLLSYTSFFRWLIHLSRP